MSKDIRMPWHGWLVLGVLVLFGLASAFDYVMSVTKGREFYEASGMSESQIVYFTGIPILVTVAWTVSVWCGLFAAVSLIFRASIAPLLFGITVLGNIAYGVYVYLLSDGIAAMGAMWFMPIVITVINCAMVVYSKKLSGIGVGS